MHLQRTETQPAVLSLTRVPTCSSVLWWLAENSRGHYGCHVRPVLKIRSQFIGSRGYRWSTDRLVKQPAHLYTHVTQTRVLDSWKHRTEKPGWTSSVRLWKSSSDNKRTGSDGSKQTSRWKTFWRSFSDAWFLNSDIFLFVFLKARSPMPHSGSPGLALPEERNGWPAPSDENRNLHLTWMCRSLT